MKVRVSRAGSRDVRQLRRQARPLNAWRRRRAAVWAPASSEYSRTSTLDLTSAGAHFASAAADRSEELTPEILENDTPGRISERMHPAQK